MGQPNFERVDDKRYFVEELAGQGVSQEDIARMVALQSPKKLRKYFPDEVDLGALRANHAVAKTLYEMATSGDSASATVFWLKCRARWTVKPDSGLIDEDVELVFGRLERVEN